MEDGALASYLPLEGDRVLTRKYCEEKQKTEKAKSMKREEVKAALKTQMSLRSRRTSDRCLPKKSNASKDSRTVTMCWSDFNFQAHEYRGVRTGNKCLSGERSMLLKKNSSKAELVQLGKELFFPNGESGLGSSENYDFDLALDAKGSSRIPEQETLGETLLRTKMKHPRFYLLSKRVPSDSDDSDDLPTLNLGHRAATDTSDVLCINSDSVLYIVSEEPSTSCNNLTYEVNTQAECPSTCAIDGKEQPSTSSFSVQATAQSNPLTANVRVTNYMHILGQRNLSQMRKCI